MNVSGTQFPALPVVPAVVIPPAAAAPPPPTQSAMAPAQASSLRDILTAEERAFFDQEARFGSLTYRPNRPSTDPTGPTGQRVDVRG